MNGKKEGYHSIFADLLYLLFALYRWMFAAEDTICLLVQLF
jgi:hypothetical protein